MEGSLCRVYSAACLGLDVVQITIEVSISRGVGLFLVGLPDNAVRESLLQKQNKFYYECCKTISPF